MNTGPRGDAPPVHAPIDRRFRRSISIAVVLMLVASGGGLGAWYFESHSHLESGAPIRGDGPTFYQAISAVNRSVQNSTGGPWVLYWMVGVATPLPFAPNALGWVNNSEAVNACGEQFNGITLWNGSIPLFNGTYNSGTAPFWQFGFYSNASDSILIATDVLGSVTTYPPILTNSSCAHASDIAAVPWVWAREFSPFPADSPRAALSATGAIGGKWMSENFPGAQIYYDGFSYWGSGNPTAFVVEYERCGLVGYTGQQPFVDVMMNRNGSWNSYFNGTQGCGNVGSLSPLILNPYGVQFSSNGTSIVGTTLQSKESLRVTYNSTGGNWGDAGGLVSWMTRLNLTGPTGDVLPPTPATCSHWVPTLLSCQASSNGWFAVLVSSSGGWLDSYPASNLSSWEVPNVSLVSQQELVIVTPSSWDLAGDRLTVIGTALDGPVSGSTVL
jgi:hypothetical protein